MAVIYTYLHLRMKATPGPQSGIGKVALRRRTEVYRLLSTTQSTSGDNCSEALAVLHLHEPDIILSVDVPSQTYLTVLAKLVEVSSFRDTNPYLTALAVSLGDRTWTLIWVVCDQCISILGSSETGLAKADPGLE